MPDVWVITVFVGVIIVGITLHQYFRLKRTRILLQKSGGHRIQELVPVLDLAITLDLLYERVTAAILATQRAESEGNIKGSLLAHLEVSFLEDEIAHHLPAQHPEGQVARRGAIMAALHAEQYSRALSLTRRYLSEDPPEALRQQFEGLLKGAREKGWPV